MKWPEQSHGGKGLKSRPFPTCKSRFLFQKLRPLSYDGLRQTNGKANDSIGSWAWRLLAMRLETGADRRVAVLRRNGADRCGLRACETRTFSSHFAATPPEFPLWRIERDPLGMAGTYVEH